MCQSVSRSMDLIVIFATSETMKCFKCKAEGHLIRNCPERMNAAPLAAPFAALLAVRNDAHSELTAEVSIPPAV